MNPWPQIPGDVVTWFRGVFFEVNRRVCERLVNLPNVRETSLDDCLVDALIPQTAPTLLSSGAIVRMDTHNIGGLRTFQRWETADIAILVFIYRREKLIAKKIGLLQSKRLFPDNKDVDDEDPAGFLYGMNAFIQREPTQAIGALYRNFLFSENCVYGAISSGSDQISEIDDLNLKFGKVVYYLLYNPHSMPLSISYPLPERIRLDQASGGCRVFDADQVHQVLANLTKGDSPTFEMLNRTDAATVAFAVSVEHSIHIRDEFIRSGVRAEHIDGGTPKDERDASLARLASGQIDLVSNCIVLTEGWDFPAAGCCILARPTKKMGLYRQMIGRVLRPANGKPDAIILDHSGAVFRHGFVEDEVCWTLDPDRKAETPAHKPPAGHASRILECTQCGAVRIAGEPCSHCGFLPQRPPRSISFNDGDLAEVGRDRRVNRNIYDPELRQRWHAMLIHIGQERGYKPGWAAFKYKEKFVDWPAWGASPQPIPPTPEVRSWVRSRMIAYAKRREVA